MPRALFAARWLSDSVCAAGPLGWARLWGLQNEQRDFSFTGMPGRGQTLLELLTCQTPHGSWLVAPRSISTKRWDMEYGVNKFICRSSDLRSAPRGPKLGSLAVLSTATLKFVSSRCSELVPQ